MSIDALPANSRAQVLYRFVSALSRGDLDGVLAEMAEDGVIRMPAAPPGADRELSGRRGVAKLVGHVGTTWKSIGVRNLEVWCLEGDPNRVLGQYVVEGVNLDDTHYRNEYVALGTVVDGKLTCFVEYFDPDPIVGALDALREHLGKPRTRTA